MCYEDHIHDQRLLNLVTCSTQFHYVKIKHVLFLSPLTHSRTTSLYSLKIQKFLYSHCLSQLFRSGPTEKNLSEPSQVRKQLKQLFRGKEAKIECKLRNERVYVPRSEIWISPSNGRTLSRRRAVLSDQGMLTITDKEPEQKSLVLQFGTKEVETLLNSFFKKYIIQARVISVNKITYSIIERLSSVLTIETSLHISLQ